MTEYLNSILLTDQHRELLRGLVGWALDQDHDARSMGDQSFLYFLADMDGDPESAEIIDRCLEIRNELLALAEKVQA